MDLNYLQNVVLPKREKEILDGKNLATRQRIPAPESIKKAMFRLSSRAIAESLK